MKRLTEIANGQALAKMCGENCEHQFCCKDRDFSECAYMDEIIDRLAAYENTGLMPEQIAAMQGHNTALVCKLQDENRFEKAFALLCRELDDFAGLAPCQVRQIDWPECNGESEQCGDQPIWQCWRKYILDRVDSEPVCRECGCTQYNACAGEHGDTCHWVESDLCSSCADEAQAEEEDAK